MAKARQNLKRRTYSATLNVVTEEDAKRRDRLAARRNTKKAGVTVTPALSREEDVIVKVNEDGEVEHEHGPNCAHDRE